jgi:predicted nucleic acid-binding Zn ribbon protein
MDQLIKTLPAILRASGASEEVREAACIAAWKKAVGEALSGHAIPIQLLNQTLVVVVADNIWLRQLEQLRGQLLHRLNAMLGQPLVKSIELRVNPKALAQAQGQQAQAKSSLVNYEVPPELLSAAAEISDVNLRRAFLGAATTCDRRLEQS